MRYQIILLITLLFSAQAVLATNRTVTGDCNGGADVTVFNETYVKGEAFNCGAAGTLTFGGSNIVESGAAVTLSAGTVRLIPPVTIASGATFRADTAITGTNRAMLGPLAGATINAYRITDLNTPIETHQAADLPAGLAVAGRFHLSLNGIGNDEWVLVTATGGQDIDFDDNNVLDASPTANQGTIHALATAQQWRSGGVVISALSDTAWRYTKSLVEQVAPEELHTRLDNLANYLITEDINGDGVINARDLTAFIPNNAQHQAKLLFGYASLFDDGNGNSLIDALHGTDPALVEQQLERLFGHSLSLNTAPDSRYSQIKIEASLFGKGSILSADGKLQLDADSASENSTSAWYTKDLNQTITLTVGCRNVPH